MGLLTDPGIERSPLPALLEKHHRPLCVCLYVFGCVWFLALAHNSLNHGTYFSENALLPGLVQGDFQGDSEVLQYLKSLQEEGEKHPSSMPHPWLIGQFTQLGLDTYTHSFTLQYPMGQGKVREGWTDKNGNFTGRNVYAILRASRGSSTEALVVAAPYRTTTSILQNTAPSIALMLAMAKFFSKQVYWAKDIIFLITEHEQLGAQAWLQAYHSPPSQPLTPHHAATSSHLPKPLLVLGDLEGRAGAIQAGINLEIHSSEVRHLDIKLEGLNGQLPNLDLVNLIHRLCQRENVQHTFKNRVDHPRPESFNGWVHQLITLLSMVTTQASGVPTGNHGLFHRYGVAAVTISGAGREAGWAVGAYRARSVNLYQIGRVLEGVCRSLNNLLEKFHQSFFFYLLPATNRYISIGVYMPPFSLIAGGVLVKALALWYSTSCRDAEKIDHHHHHTLLSWSPAVVVVHSACILISSLPIPFTHLGLQFDLTPEDSVCIGVVACCVVMMLLSFSLIRYNYEDSGWEVLKIIVLLELGVVLFAGAVYNFSLALIVAVIYTPIALLASPSRSRMLRLFKSALLLLVHPLSLLFLVVVGDTYVHFPELEPLKLLLKGGTAAKRALMFSVVDSMIYSNWVFDVAVLCLLPVWTLLWVVVQHPYECVVKKEECKCKEE